MLRFDWQRFCDRQGIAYVTSGANTARGNISIHCPFCGPADPSEHLGLKLDPRDPQWGCFRNSGHRGKHPARLVSRLLNISLPLALRLVDEERPPIDSLGDVLHMLKNGPDASDRVPSGPRKVMPLSGFRPLASAVRSSNAYAQRFLAYLADRGFGKAAADVAEQYQLWYALTGEQRWRIIFPVLGTAGELIGWTGRSIQTGAKLRYSAMPEMGKDWLLTSPRKEPADVLVVCEGPIDFLKIDYYGRPFGIEAVGTMGTAVTSGQFAQLTRLMKTKRKTYSLFDAEAFAQSFRLSSELSRGARFNRIPSGYEDPGAMNATTSRDLCRLLAG